jgi:S-DNA-T family DNA segregation ATPase FtsK/SpoIIIE
VHGLVIGATGSGKSELLRTIVTSLAITHDPETVNFVLADFKGGAAFADLATLPHAAGMISNLQSDLSLVDRMQAALTGEQERRQRMLREAGNLDNIRQYHIKRQSYPAMEPLPYLLIIVDEFAELLASKPDFLDVFVAIGRVGRSLGMHLLLATQRLSEGRIQGLEGHLRYRICLRTFSASESSSVIGTPDAFYLPSFPGIGYFKVDTNIYRQFKTALVSNPYVPATQTATASVTLREFSPTGRLIAIAPAAQGRGRAGEKPEMAPAGDELKTDMDVIITRLLKARDPNDRAAVHQVWLPPLSASVSLSDVLARCNLERLDGSEWPAPPLGVLRIPVGLLDKPAEQAQESLILDFSGAGGHLAIAGAPQSGKSTLLQAIVASFAVTHSPRDVQLYCIDMGGGQLRAFQTAPHVGAVCGKMERDKVRRLVRQMRSIIEAREYLFHERRIDGMSSFRARRQAGELADVPFGDVFLVIDDLAQLQSEFDGLDAELIDIVASGLTYGVHVIVASNRWPDIRPKLRDNIGTRIELRLNEPSESEIGKKSAETLQGVAPGRGLVKGGLQFQVALPRVDAYDGAALQPLSASLQAFVERMRAAWTGLVAPPVRMLPQLVTSDDLMRPGVEVRPGVPIGLEEFQLEPIYMDLATMGPHFLIFGDSECGKTSLLYAWMRGLEQRYLSEQVQFGLVDFRRNLVDLLGSPQMFDHGYACTPQMLKDLLDRLKGALDGRMLSGANLTIEDLRKVGSWNGPHYYLFVDDYESLVTPAGSPLAPLADLIQQGRDVGLHVVLARRVSGTTRTAFEPVFQRLKESGSPGLVMSGDPQEGVLLGTQRATELPPGRGYLVRRNQRTALVQTVFIER